MSDAEQLALDGLAPRKRRRAPAEHTPAAHDPVAHVVLDVQAMHLGQTFDYLIDEKDSDTAVPGALVRVRFGGQRVNGVIWDRSATSDTPRSSLRYLERVLGGDVLVPASMRDDITAIAEAYGGTRANILRLAVPPRVVKIEREQRLAASFNRRPSPILSQAVQRRGEMLEASYGQWNMLRDALAGTGFRPFVFDSLPGMGEQARCVAWMIAQSYLAGHGAVVVLPTMREVGDVMLALRELGLRPFGPAAGVGDGAHADDERSERGMGAWRGDVAVLTASTAPADRYRAYFATAIGQVRCVIGTRAAMYAPVDGPALFAIVDDVAYQQADGMMPYAQARGVLRLRAERHGGVFVAIANARSSISHAEVEGIGAATATGGPATAIHALPTVTRERMPWVRWLNRDELARLADPSIGARVPHTAVNNIRQALDSGPVLFSIPSDGVSEALSCAACHRQARCRRCSGPLATVAGNRTPRCRWCGAAAVNWVCPGCKGERLRVVRVGAAGTADELRKLFRGVPMLLSSPSQPKGVIHEITAQRMIVIATPGAEPRVNPVTDEQGAAGHEYSAVAILDAWTSLYSPGMDARVDTLTAWMRVAATCAPRSRGGQVLILGETDPAIAQSMMMWNSALLAAKDVEERGEIGLPPVVTAACVWGQRDAVRSLLLSIGAMDGGDMAVCTAPDGRELPAVLGPVPIPPPRTVDARELEVTADRVKAVVLVPRSRRGELARRLHLQVARHVAARKPGELRFQIDPKDLI
ncbi:primosome assembly protein PriA [Bifidobacterium eulemuris]|nr:primosome assembly protein PriA [Bifidobacterium eulemuris]